MTMILRAVAVFSVLVLVESFTAPRCSRRGRIRRLQSSNEEDAQRLQEQAQQLRESIRKMEDEIGQERRSRFMSGDRNVDDGEDDIIPEGKSLKNKRVLIVGANGRLGSMITRHLLRTHPEVKEVVAAVHYVGQATTRGWGRLSYEVGAEDGKGSIGAAWAPEEERNASFQFDPEVMSGYNLNKLRIVEVELLDPVQVSTITEDVDAVIFAATDFEGNRPRAVASLNAAFLFRAVASPTKGRVEVEGVRNCIEGFLGNLSDRRYKERLEPARSSTAVATESEPTQFVLVSTAPGAFGEFETPFGEFNGIKRQGEYITMQGFPSLSYTVLQMGKFDDNFVEEGQELNFSDAEDDTEVVDGVIQSKRIENKEGTQLRINRRDAARAAVEALLDEGIEGKKVQVHTATRPTDVW
mmetsp:Transcript_10238/g.22184  ORF Transcript_10238/g.22184 Transcript_10238/m.22184 type:complete len:411 (+) Transcript_10238:240-1472(+)